MAALVEISDILAGLTARIEDLARELLPAGRREGKDWVDARRAQGGHGDSLKVCIRGPRAGLWAYFGGDLNGIDRGDALDLVAALAAGGDKGRAIVWSKRWLGLEAGDPDTLRRQRRANQAARAKADAAAAEELARRRNQAMAIWRAGQPLRGSMGEAYLAGRGIDFARLGRYPRALRFMPRLFEPETGGELPALVACMTLADGGFAAVHRIWLERQGEQVIKASTITAKKSLGPYRGGAIRLWRGAAKRFDEAGEIMVTEGIEDGLTAAMVAPQASILVSVSLANLRALELWPATKVVKIVADNDAPGSPAALLLDQAVERFRRQGRWVSICRAEGGKDLNDMLRTGAG